MKFFTITTGTTALQIKYGQGNMVLGQSRDSNSRNWMGESWGNFQKLHDYDWFEIKCAGMGQGSWRHVTPCSPLISTCVILAHLKGF